MNNDSLQYAENRMNIVPTYSFDAEERFGMFTEQPQTIFSFLNDAVRPEFGSYRIQEDMGRKNRNSSLTASFARCVICERNSCSLKQVGLGKFKCAECNVAEDTLCIICKESVTEKIVILSCCKTSLCVTCWGELNVGSARKCPNCRSQ